ncbi:MAG: gliding motility-associated C-terminal domain-containing protein [Bacteroidota bacterium]
MPKHLFSLPFFLFGLLSMAQSALYNTGNLRIHNNAQLGFHTDLINNGVFDGNAGLAGFYGENGLTVSGALPLQFFDMELLQENGLFLETSVSVTNNMNFVLGNINSAKDSPEVYLNFMPNAFFTGENDLAKVNGFAAITNRQFFSFPVGDTEQLRPLILDSDGVNVLAKCAYFFDNPNNPIVLDVQFDTDQKVRDIGEITQNEFWVLEGDVSSTVTLSWNERSNLGAIATVPEDLIIVGYNIAANQWVVLGNTAFGGNLEQGFMTSGKFLPSNYAAITFGTIPLPLDTFAVNNPTLGNYFLSPDGDGINDFLVIDGLEESPNNNVQIFNRFGQKVFEKANYVNEFNGISNTNNFVLNKDVGLPEGVYFYIARLDDLNLDYQGFLFLNR